MQYVKCPYTHLELESRDVRQHLSFSCVRKCDFCYVLRLIIWNDEMVYRDCIIDDLSVYYVQ